MSCSALQQGDEMFCARCGLRWDVGDEDRPACVPRLATGTNIKRLKATPPGHEGGKTGDKNVL